MEISDLLAPEAVLGSLHARSKKQLMHDLAARAAQLSGLPEGRIFETLLERERLGSTGMGQGIAIPHGRFSGLSRIVGLFARLDPPVAFDAVDDRPVDLVFVLLAPDEAGADYLKALARVSRLLRNQTTCERLRAAGNAEVLYSLLTDSTNGHGAQAA
jgi:PTS system nitrogen regulatory IIA component